LRREADRSVGGAETLIGPALDELEEEAIGEAMAVDLEELTVTLAVIEDAVGARSSW
jgi:hypothetical protein